jgi:hypothetical protein
LRWANDKYKGTQAFRATLWHREDENLPGNQQLGWILAAREKKLSDSYTTPPEALGTVCMTIPGRRSFKLHATEIPLSGSNRTEKINVAPRSRQFTSAMWQKSAREFLKKFKAAKKSGAYAFPAGEVRASMPTSRKNFVAQRSVQRSASSMQSKTVSPSSTTGPGRLAT